MNPQAIELINSFLRKLCRELGAPAAELDSAGGVGLEGRFRGEDVSVTIAYRDPEEMIQLLAPIPGSLDEALRQRMATGFLALNLSPQDTAGLAFGLSPVDGTLVLTCSLMGLDHSYRTFRTTFFRLFGAAAVWRGRLREMTAATQE